MGKVADILNSEEFASLSAFEKVQRRKELFYLTLEQNPDLKTKFDLADPAGKQQIADTVREDMRKQFPDAWKTKGWSLSKGKDGIEYKEASVPIYDTATEELIQSARASLPSGIETESETKARREFWNSQLTPEQREKIAPFVYERYGRADPEIFKVPEVKEDKSGLRKFADIAIPTAARVAPPLLASLTKNPRIIAAAAAGGEGMGQSIEQLMGTRDSLSPVELGIGTATSIIPMVKIKQLSNVVLSRMANTGVRGVEGFTMGAGSETLRALAEGEDLNAGNILTAGAVGTAIGGTLGSVEGVGAKPKVQTPDAPAAAATTNTTAPDAPPVIPTTEGTGVPTERRFVTRIKESEGISDTIKNQLDSFYNPKSNAPTAEFARQYVDDNGLDRSKTAFLENKTSTAESNAVGLELHKRYLEQGREQDSIDIIDALAEKSETAGAAIQYLSRLRFMTPEGAVYYAQKVRRRLNKDLPDSKLPEKISPEQVRRIRDAQAEIGKVSDPDLQMVRTVRLIREINSGIPGDWGSKIRATANLSMLLSPKTWGRNILGNAIMWGGETIADIASVPLDIGFSVFTGKHTIAGPKFAARLKGLLQPVLDIKAGYQQGRKEGMSVGRALAEGVDTMAELSRLTSMGKYDIKDIGTIHRRTFDNKVGNALEKTLTTVLGAPDRAFYMSRYKSSLTDQMKAAHVDTPSVQMHERASLEAARSIYQDQNKLSKELNNFRKMLNRLTTAGHSEQIGLGQAILPFTQVPGSLIVRAAEFSPLGFIRGSYGIVKGITSGKFNQRDISQQFSKALVGTGGLVGTGLWLEKIGVLTGAPDENKDVEALRRSLGLGAYRINLSELKRRFVTLDWDSPARKPQPNDLIMSYDWAQPLAIPVAMGANISQAMRSQENKGLVENALSVAKGSIATLEEQPLLTGMARLFRDVGQRDWLSAGFNAGLSLPGQFSPAALNAVEQLRQDRISEVRHSNRVTEATQRIATRIPYLQDKLGFPQKYDVLGQAVERYGNTGNGFFNVLINPALTSRVKNDPAGMEMLKLYRITNDASVLPVNVDRKISIMNDGIKTDLELDSQQIADYQYAVGNVSRQLYEGLLTSPKFVNLPPQLQARTMGMIFTKAHEATKMYLFNHRPQNPDRDSVAIFAAMVSGDMPTKPPPSQ